MPSMLARLILFLSSYAPLLLLFASLDSFGSQWSRLICLALAVASLIALVIYWRSIRSEPSAYKTTEIKSAAPRNLDVIGYFVSYVIPFVAAPSSDVAGRVSLLFLFVVVAGFYFQRDGSVHPMGCYEYGPDPHIGISSGEARRQHEGRIAIQRRSDWHNRAWSDAMWARLWEMNLREDVTPQKWKKAVQS